MKYATYLLHISSIYAWECPLKGSIVLNLKNNKFNILTFGHIFKSFAHCAPSRFVRPGSEPGYIPAFAISHAMRERSSTFPLGLLPKKTVLSAHLTAGVAARDKPPPGI